MITYNKNSVKLLPIIENYQNNTAFYTEFDGKYEIGDKLHIMVLNDSTPDYLIDSFNTSGNTNIGYELLYKDNNKLILDISYEDIVSSGLTGLTESNCFIGSIYIKTGKIDRGIINNTMMYNITLEPNSNFNIIWKQGIIYSVNNKIQNINFVKKPENKLLLKSELLNNTINSYYVENFDELSIINLSKNHLELLSCNISDGVLYNCDLTGYLHTIDGGKLIDCLIGPNYIINGGEFIDSELYDLTIKWNSGTWNSSWTGTTNNPFSVLDWENGIWKKGIFPETSIWFDGRFLDGTFEGQIWYNGIFSYNDINRESTDAVFQNTIWENGIFNGGTMNNSSWISGDFNYGTMYNTVWENGNFNNGTIISDSGATYKNWENGNFNGGKMEYMNWLDGEFNNGEINNSNWYGGNFNNGVANNMNWYGGNWFGGKLQNSIWHNGKFYNGSMFDSWWKNGELYFGTLNTIEWSGGTWLNGIANNVNFQDGNWYNGIWNFGYFYKGNWYDGSFNSGFFSGKTTYTDAVWHNGNFYFGEFKGSWIKGIFYTGKDDDHRVPISDYIGRPYKQYNKGKLTDVVHRKDRLPSKKRY